jgi:hypothetical protein
MMKYIVFDFNGKETIVLFPRTLIHKEVSDAVKTIKTGRGRDWKRQYKDSNVISAGFFDLDESDVCYGESESLCVKSRPEEDAALLNFGLKYIVFDFNECESPVIFPKTLDHDYMAEAFCRVKFLGRRRYRSAKILSAGFYLGGDCTGKSESLNIKSRENIDTKLMYSLS